MPPSCKDFSELTQASPQNLDRLQPLLAKCEPTWPSPALRPQLLHPGPHRPPLRPSRGDPAPPPPTHGKAPQVQSRQFPTNHVMLTLIAKLVASCFTVMASRRLFPERLEGRYRFTCGESQIRGSTEIIPRYTETEFLAVVPLWTLAFFSTACFFSGGGGSSCLRTKGIPSMPARHACDTMKII